MSGNRRARLILVTPEGQLQGQLPEFEVSVPFWSEVESVVAEARHLHEVDVTIVRILDIEDGDIMRGGLVTYLALTDQAVTCEPWHGTLDDHPNRNRYAEIDNARADLEWALGVLRERGRKPSGNPIQIRTWNLSSLWRIPVDDTQVWLKSVPTFFYHEGALIEALSGSNTTPDLIDRKEGAVLLADVEGTDLYDASLSQRFNMIESLVRLQLDWVNRTDELLSLGLPDVRSTSLLPRLTGVIEKVAPDLSVQAAGPLDKFANDLEARFADIRACGLPDTLMHGDFHPGNWRGDEHRMTLLDWADASVGHPLLDLGPFINPAPEDWREPLQQRWLELWQDAYPGSDPVRAWVLLEPVGAVRAASIYRDFLDHIEPAEWHYHAPDPVNCLNRAASLLAN